MSIVTLLQADAQQSGKQRQSLSCCALTEVVDSPRNRACGVAKLESDKDSICKRAFSCQWIATIAAVRMGR
jgi:hypothetical protein